MVGNPDQVQDGGNWRVDWVRYPSYGEPWTNSTESPVIELPPRRRIVRCLYGLGDRWIDLADRLPTDGAPFSVTNLWAGSDPVPFHAKQLRLELNDGSTRVAHELDRVALRRGGLERLDAVRYINLDERRDRRAEVENEFTRLGFGGARRAAGVRRDNGALGCALAHLNVLEHAEREGWSAFMVCEDDVHFLVDRPRLDRFIDAFLDDDSAEVLCLAFCAFEVQPRCAELRRTTNTQTASCYVVKRSVIEALRAQASDGAARLAAGGSPSEWAFDQVWKRIQRERVFVVPSERAAKQRSSFSDIERRRVAYGV